MSYDPRTLLARYRLASELSPEGEQPDCPLSASGMPPASPEDCALRGCTLACVGLASIAKRALVALCATEALPRVLSPGEPGETVAERSAVLTEGEGDGVDGDCAP